MTCTQLLHRRHLAKIQSLLDGIEAYSLLVDACYAAESNITHPLRPKSGHTELPAERDYDHLTFFS